MFGLGLGRFLPAAARGLLVEAVLRYQSMKPRALPFGAERPRRAYEGREVVIAGLFSTRSGLGRGAELFARDFEARGKTVHRLDLTPFLRLPQTLSPEGTIDLAQACRTTASDVIIFVNPPLFHDVVLAFDRAWLAERCVIGHWVWELDRLPRSWVRATAACDEIWAASEFVAGAVRKSASKFSGPVRVAPYPVDRDPIAPTTPTERAAARAQLGLGEHTFCVGYSFSAASNFERKNPEGVVAAFQQAFPSGDADASLLLRALDLDIFPAGAKRLRAAAAADPRIRIFEAAGETLSLRSFYSAIDVYLAPFRSEGFGLNLVEASQAGIPVVASGYGVDEAVSAHPGIHLVSWRLVPVRERQGHYVDVKGACWAEPDMGEISVALRALRTGRR